MQIMGFCTVVFKPFTLVDTSIGDTCEGELGSNFISAFEERPTKNVDSSTNKLKAAIFFI